MWLVICAHDCAFNMNDLTKFLGVGSGNLRGADPEVMEAIIGAKAGGVNLFAILNDPDNKVKLVMDQNLYTNFEFVGFHPMQNDHTTAIKREDVKKIIDISKHEPLNVDFTTLGGGAAADKKEAPAPTKKEAPAKKEAGKPKKEEAKKEGQHELGIEYTREGNFSKWYS